MTTPAKKKSLLINIIFVAVLLGILGFLMSAPDITTPTLPHDDDHERFFSMKKKTAENFCVECHTPEGVYPLPEDHPPKLRCLFCHRRD